MRLHHPHLVANVSMRAAVRQVRSIVEEGRRQRWELQKQLTRTNPIKRHGIIDEILSKRSEQPVDDQKEGEESPLTSPLSSSPSSSSLSAPTPEYGRGRRKTMLSEMGILKELAASSMAPQKRLKRLKPRTNIQRSSSGLGETGAASSSGASGGVADDNDDDDDDDGVEESAIVDIVVKIDRRPASGEASSSSSSSSSSSQVVQFEVTMKDAEGRTGSCNHRFNE